MTLTKTRQNFLLFKEPPTLRKETRLKSLFHADNVNNIKQYYAHNRKHWFVVHIILLVFKSLLKHNLVVCSHHSSTCNWTEDSYRTFQPSESVMQCSYVCVGAEVPWGVRETDDHLTGNLSYCFPIALNAHFGCRKNNKEIPPCIHINIYGYTVHLCVCVQLFFFLFHLYKPGGLFFSPQYVNIFNPRRFNCIAKPGESQRQTIVRYYEAFYCGRQNNCLKRSRSTIVLLFLKTWPPPLCVSITWGRNIFFCFVLFFQGEIKKKGKKMCVCKNA